MARVEPPVPDSCTAFAVNPRKALLAYNRLSVARACRPSDQLTSGKFAEQPGRYAKCISGETA